MRLGNGLLSTKPNEQFVVFGEMRERRHRLIRASSLRSQIHVQKKDAVDPIVDVTSPSLVIFLASCVPSMRRAMCLQYTEREAVQRADALRSSAIPTESECRCVSSRRNPSNEMISKIEYDRKFKETESVYAQPPSVHFGKWKFPRISIPSQSKTPYANTYASATHFLQTIFNKCNP